MKEVLGLPIGSNSMQKIVKNDKHEMPLIAKNKSSVAASMKTQPSLKQAQTSKSSKSGSTIISPEG